jgi:hypothetical protein
MSYEKWLPAQATPPFRDANGEHLLGMLGKMLDAERDKALQGTLARFPLKGSVDVNGIYGPPPSEALDAMGFDRGIPRAGTETADNGGPNDLAYAARLNNAWTSWTYAGAHYGVLRALSVAGFITPSAIIVQDNGRYSQLTGVAGTIADLTIGDLAICANRAGLPGWTFDHQTNYFSRFAIIYTSMPAALNSKSGQTIHNKIVNQWRPGKADFIGTTVITSGRIFGFAASPPTLPLWGSVGNWGGAATFIPPTI